VTAVTESPIVRTVRAVVFDRYGPPDVLRIEEIEKPALKDDEALVRVHAASATRSDCGLRGAEYLVGRLFTGLFRPKPDRRRVGLEVAGEVEAVGASVTQFAAGDRLFGICSGGNADYVCVPQGEAIARIPDGVGFVDAAGVADGGLSAISLLRSAGLEEGGRIAINGASGSIGVGGVQVAKQLGAHVTAVCSTRAVELMRALGADEVVAYERAGFTKNDETYDVVFDAAGKTTYGRFRRSLAADGVYITTDPGFLWRDAFVALVSKRAKLGIVRYTKADIEKLAGLLGAGEYRPVIDRTYPLEEVVEAHRYVESHQ
jgi:NADPH:quinone reductase-like Zn-dependent oxidoreductase